MSAVRTRAQSGYHVRPNTSEYGKILLEQPYPKCLMGFMRTPFQFPSETPPAKLVFYDEQHSLGFSTGRSPCLLNQAVFASNSSFKKKKKKCPVKSLVLTHTKH